MIVVGFNLSSNVVLYHDHDEVVRAARAALIYISDKSNGSLEPDEIKGKLIEELKVFGDFEVGFCDPEGGELEFPDPMEYVVVEISTNQARQPMIH